MPPTHEKNSKRKREGKIQPKKDINLQILLLPFFGKTFKSELIPNHSLKEAYFYTRF